MKFGSVLITGGTGFFGQGLVRELLHKNLSERICIYSRDEYKQSLMRVALGDDPRLRFFIGCVRDRNRLTRAMHGVDLVVHAAALKRVETCEYNVAEAIATNVTGSQNVVDAAIDAGVAKVVFLSTDKACDPTAAYGFTKALAEKIFLGANHYSGVDGPAFSITRYGNVTRSTGSVVPTWEKMITDGAKIVPVTDPECTRFFMTLDQAVKLVIDLAHTMQGGELIVPDLPAYRLADLAMALGVGMDVRGLPITEKKHESMSAERCSSDARRMSVDEIRKALYDSIH